MRLNKNPYPKNLFEDLKILYEIDIPEDVIDLDEIYKDLAKDHYYEYAKLIVLRYEEYNTYDRIAKKLNFSKYYISALHRKTLDAVYLCIIRFMIKNNIRNNGIEFDRIWLLPPNVRSALNDNNINSIKQLEQMTKEEVSNLDGIGRIKLKKISDFLKENNTYFKK